LASTIIEEYLSLIAVVLEAFSSFAAGSSALWAVKAGAVFGKELRIIASVLDASFSTVVRSEILGASLALTISPQNCLAVTFTINTSSSHLINSGIRWASAAATVFANNGSISFTLGVLATPSVSRDFGVLWALHALSTPHENVPSSWGACLASSSALVAILGEDWSGVSVTFNALSGCDVNN
jgi:hypothetical protein